MWSKLCVLCFAMTVFLGCKKDELPWDKEKDLPSDTTIYIHHASYVSHTDTFLSFDFEFTQLNKLECETAFTDVVLAAYQPEYLQYSFSNFLVETKTVNSGYSTVLLMESTSHALFVEGRASFYFRRFFEQYEHQPAKNVGLATFRMDSDADLQFHKENVALFDNSANFNDSIINELIRLSPYQSDLFGTSANFRNVFYDVIDTLRLNPHSSGDLSITFVDDLDYHNVIDVSTMNDIITRANLYGIKINVLCLNGSPFFQLALGTGGFFIDNRESNKIPNSANDYRLSSIGNGVANLDRILSNELTVYKFRLTLNNQGISTFNSGANQTLSFTYNDYYYELNIPIP